MQLVDSSKLVRSFLLFCNYSLIMCFSIKRERHVEEKLEDDKKQLLKGKSKKNTNIYTLPASPMGAPVLGTYFVSSLVVILEAVFPNR